MVKQREEHRRIQGIKLKVVFGKKSEVLTLLGVCTGYIERCNLTNRHFKERQVRNTLTFSKGL
jgi:IS1 family transposase